MFVDVECDEVRCDQLQGFYTSQVSVGGGFCRSAGGRVDIENHYEGEFWQ
jgi:hypothetical protein